MSAPTISKCASIPQELRRVLTSLLARQDRVNLEMNLHLEGPIVQSFYDMALLSWAEKMTPPLPLLVNPNMETQLTGGDCFEQAQARKAELDKTSFEAIPAHPGRLATLRGKCYS